MKPRDPITSGSLVPPLGYRELLSGAITAVLVSIALIVVLAFPGDPGYLRATFNPLHVELLNMYDSRGQQLAHRVVFMLLACFGLSLWLFRRTPMLPGALAGFRPHLLRFGAFGVTLVALGVGALGSRAIFSDQIQFQGRYFVDFLPSLRTQIVLAAVVLSLMYAYQRWQNVLFAHAAAYRRVGAGVLVAYAGILVLLGLASDVDFRELSATLIAGTEWHFSGSVGSADRLGVGERLGTVPIHSTLLMSVLLGGWERAHGLLSFGAHIYLIVVLQAAVVIAAAWSYGRWHQWRFAPWAVATLLTVPWIQPLHAAILYPNQSMWRFFGYCTSVMLLAFVHALSPGAAAAILGFASALALAWNVETGLCIAFAYAMFVVIRTPVAERMALLRALTVFATAFVCGMAAVLAILAGALGYWPSFEALASSFPLLGSFARGYGGIRFTSIDPLALLVFCHALFIFVKGQLAWASGTALTARESCRFAMAALIVTWAAYYFKAPHSWNFWSFLFVYGFLVDSILPSGLAGGSPAPFRALLSSARVAVFALVVAPSIVTQNLGAAAAVARSIVVPQCMEAEKISGVCMPEQLTLRLRAKAAALREYELKPAVYLTANSYFVPMLTGIFPPFRERDAFFESIFAGDYERLLRELRSLRPECLLMDDPASPLSGYSQQRRFYDRIREGLSPVYEHRATMQGWERWCVRRPAT